MPKRVRPVILVVENTADVISETKKIFKNITKGYFGEDYKIVVDTFQLFEDNANKSPNFVYYRNFQFAPTNKDLKGQKEVDLNPVFECLLKFEFLNDKRKYVQPIVLIALDGSHEYIFDDEKYLKFRNTYIHSDSLRVLTFYDMSWIDGAHEHVVKCLSNNDEEVADTFLALGPYNGLTTAFWIMETYPKCESCIVDPPRYPTDTIIKNGTISKRKTKSLKKIFGWIKEWIEYRW